MDIICFGQQNWDYCWTGKQQLVTRLVDRGHRVLYIDPTWVEASRSPRELAGSIAPVWSGLGVRELERGLFVYTSPYFRWLGWRVNYGRRPRVIAQIARRLGFDRPVALAHRPQRTREYLDAIDPVARLYYAIDEFTAYGETREEAARRIRSEEEELLRDVGVALAISPRLLKRIGRLHPRTHLLESAADVDHFSPSRLERLTGHPSVACLSKPRLGFMGQIDERLDQGLVIDLARSHREWQIVFAGRMGRSVDVSSLEDEPNIHLIGFQPYEELPSVLREFDVCIIPYHLNELTQACSPLKAYEYLATGRPVVSTPLESLLPFQDVISLAGSREEFLHAVEKALANPDRGRSERLKVAEANSWNRRVDLLEQCLEEAVDVAEERRTRESRNKPLPGYRLRLSQSRPEKLSHLQVQSQRSLKERLYFKGIRALGWCYYGFRLMGRLLRGRRPVLIRRILVARDSWLGDLVVFLPALSALRRKFPHAYIVLGVQPGFSTTELFEGSNEIDEIQELGHFSWGAGFFRTLLDTFRVFVQGFDLVISGVDFTLRREAFFCGAPYQIGLYNGHPLQTFNQRVIRSDRTRHEAENNLALIEILGGGAEKSERVPRLTLNEEKVAKEGEAFFRQLGIFGQTPVLAVHPGTKNQTRRWPGEKFAELINRILTRYEDLQIVFTGTLKETPLVNSLRKHLRNEYGERVFSSVGRTSLSGLVGVLDRADVVLSNDTGVMHVARARQRPLVALLGPGDERRWEPYPWGSSPAVTLRHEVPCAPCSRNLCEEHFCMLSLRVDEVEKEVCQLLDTVLAGKFSKAEHKKNLPSVHREDVSSEGVKSKFQDACFESKDDQDEAELIPLRRRVTRHSWESLQASGFSLPLVSIVIWADGEFVSENGSVPLEKRKPVADVTEEEIAEALRMVERQSYPHLEAVIVNPGREIEERSVKNLKEQTKLPLKILQVDREEPETIWQGVYEKSRGEYLSPLLVHQRWSRRKIAADVAVLQREPRVAAVSCSYLDKPSGLLSQIPAGLTTFRRRSLETVLNEEMEAESSKNRSSSGSESLHAAWDYLSRITPVFPLHAAFTSAGNRS